MAFWSHKGNKLSGNFYFYKASQFSTFDPAVIFKIVHLLVCVYHSSIHHNNNIYYQNTAHEVEDVEVCCQCAGHGYEHGVGEGQQDTADWCFCWWKVEILGN